MDDMSSQERMARVLQQLEDQMGSNVLVGPFLVIMEVEMPDAPDDIAYHVFRKGSPASQLGLVDYLSSNVHEHVFYHKDE